ncbi:MAG: riboflavin biosynthesis protein RibF [Planctomycetota bacterium]
MSRLVFLDPFQETPPQHDDFATTADLRGGAISIGNFDGVHLGHRDLLKRVRRAADDEDGPALAMVLDPHPTTILRPHSAATPLTTIERRAELMGKLGMDALVVCRTSARLLDLTADAFFDTLILERLAVRAMVEGPNFFFGRDRGGDVRHLEARCRQSGVKLTIVKPQLHRERMISSTRIREQISAGEIETATAMLGSEYRIHGKVIEGDQRGRTLGFPTANLAEIATLLPAHGVYAGVATIGAAESLQPVNRPFPAAIHIGPNPTFGMDSGTKVEVHLLGYDGNLYGQWVDVSLDSRIRTIRQFDSPESLRQQLTQDIAVVRDRIQPAPFQS